jgi:predicted secreted Zn-dependent protease
MRHCFIYFIICFFVLTGTAFAEVNENLEYKYYDVKAEVGDPLRPHILSATPLRKGEKKVTGNIRWNIKWHPQVESDSTGACHISSVSTTFNAVITLPKLIGGDDLQKTNFDRYLIVLRKHELTHYGMYLEAAREIDSTLKELPPIYDCKELKALADKIGYCTLDYVKEKNRQYDAEASNGNPEGIWIH